MPHCVRICKGCGRKMQAFEPGEGGKGIMVQEGDEFVIPAGFFKLSLNPLESNVHFLPAGLQWFAELIFVDQLTSREDQLEEVLATEEVKLLAICRESPIVQGFDISVEDEWNKALGKLLENKQTAEFWAALAGIYLGMADFCIKQGDARKSAWAMACFERCRAMLIFKQKLEIPVWMGQSARRLINLLDVWHEHKENDDEAFWQDVFTRNSYALSQVFSYPVVYLKSRAYVGGVTIDGDGGKYLDFLASNDVSREAVLIEFKTPKTRLLGGEYRRNVFQPSNELGGAVVQVLEYRSQLASHLHLLTRGKEYEINYFQPKCVLIIGNASAELDSEARRKSFEMLRTQFKDVEIVTYDEVFRKVEILATLFGLVTKRDAKT